jgi:hypothetical protein
MVVSKARHRAVDILMAPLGDQLAVLVRLPAVKALHALDVMPGSDGARTAGGAGVGW